MDSYELCGFIGGILFPISILPQVYKSYIEKDLSNISYYWQIIFIIALILTLIYSIHNGLWPVILSSIIEIILTIIIIGMKFYYNKFKEVNIDNTNV